MQSELVAGAVPAVRRRRLIPGAPDALVVTALGLRDGFTRGERPRIPEPMVIDEADAVARFSEGAASQPAMRNVYDFQARALNVLVPRGGRVLDLGVGSGHALAHFLQRRPDVTAVGVDLSEGMLDQARAMFHAAGLGERVSLLRADMCDLPAEVDRVQIDAVASIWTLHQLPDLRTLSAALDSVAAVRKRHGAAVWLLDFQRLSRADSFADMLAATDPHYPAALRQDALDSEAAAFTAAELREQLTLAGLGDARHRVTVPLKMLQAAWLAGRRDASDGAAAWVEVPLDAETERRATMLRRAFSTSRKAPLPRGKAVGDRAKTSAVRAA
jgi:SAM-dependent methyltransferase